MDATTNLEAYTIIEGISHGNSIGRSEGSRIDLGDQLSMFTKEIQFVKSKSRCAPPKLVSQFSLFIG